MAENKEEKPAQQFQRNTIIVKKHLQYRYMALIFTSVLAAFLIVGLDLMWTVSKVVNEHPMMQPLLENMFSMAPLFMIKIVMYMVIVLILSAVVSHRMAGPIYKFEKSCAAVAAGELTHRVYLRKGDQLIDLQEHFNVMLGALNETVSVLEDFKRTAVAAHPDLKDRAEAASGKIASVMPNYKI